MAGNSVPAFFGKKAKSKKPTALDVTFITDLSGSMDPYASFITSTSTVLALENALVSEGVGGSSIINRYSFATGADRSRTTLSSVERNVQVGGVSVRWAPGDEVRDGNVVLPIFVVEGGTTEDMSLSSYLVATSDRDYDLDSSRVIISGSDEQSYLTFQAQTLSALTTPSTAQRYVGIHSLSIATSEPVSPNPIPPGVLFGVVFTTPSVGALIYLDGSTPRTRTAVDLSRVSVVARPAASGSTQQFLIDLARNTNGAVYNIALSNTSAGTTALATSLGEVLGQYLFEIS